MTNNLRLKRAYEPRSSDDGERYLVDRLWPRGVKKEDLALAGWLKEAAPSAELRRWFQHDPTRWDDFRARYIAELKSQPEVLAPLRDALRRGVVTLVYSARDEVHNQAVALREFLLKHDSSEPRRSRQLPPRHEN